MLNLNNAKKLLTKTANIFHLIFKQIIPSKLKFVTSSFQRH